MCLGRLPHTDALSRLQTGPVEAIQALDALDRSLMTLRDVPECIAALHGVVRSLRGRLLGRRRLDAGRRLDSGCLFALLDRAASDGDVILDILNSRHAPEHAFDGLVLALRVDVSLEDQTPALDANCKVIEGQRRVANEGSRDASLNSYVVEPLLERSIAGR